MIVGRNHTRIVTAAKIGLPLLALGLLSTIFLVSGKIDPTAVAPFYADVDLTELAREEQMTAPHYAGMTQDGDSLSVHASSALPATTANQGSSAKDLVAQLEGLKDGAVTHLTSDKGRITPDQAQVFLDGNVKMKTSTGYDLVTGSAVVQTDRSRVTMPGHVDGTGPAGTISADSGEMSRPAANAPYDLVFNGSVHLVYRPQQ